LSRSIASALLVVLGHPSAATASTRESKEKDDFSWHRRRAALGTDQLSFPRRTADCSNFLRPGLFFIPCFEVGGKFALIPLQAQWRAFGFLRRFNSLLFGIRLQKNEVCACGAIYFQLIRVKQQKYTAANALK
jgi:hypothetical protein